MPTKTSTAGHKHLDLSDDQLDQLVDWIGDNLGNDVLDELVYVDELVRFVGTLPYRPVTHAHRCTGTHVGRRPFCQDRYDCDRTDCGRATYTCVRCVEASIDEQLNAHLDCLAAR